MYERIYVDRELVVKITTDYTNGRIGRVVDFDHVNNRYQIAWINHPKTWVNARYLRVYGEGNIK